MPSSVRARHRMKFHLQGLAISSLGLLGGTLARLGLEPTLHARAPNILYIPVVVLIAASAGFAYGIASTVVACVLGMIFFVPNPHSLHDPGEWLRMVLFFFTGFVLSWLIARARKSVVVETKARLLMQEGAAKMREAAREKDRLLGSLQRSREELRAIFMQAPGTVNVFRGPDHRIEFLHPAFMARLGLGDVLGLSAREVLQNHPDLIRRLDDVYRGGHPLALTEMARLADESFENVVYQPWCDAEGVIEGVISLGVDITEQVRGRRLRRSIEGRFRVAQEINTDGFALLEATRGSGGAVEDFVIRYVNPSGAREMCSTPEELTGLHVREAFPENPTARWLIEQYKDVFQNGRTTDIEYSAKRDGELAWFRSVIAKTKDGIAVQFTNITERKLTEQAAARAQYRIEKLYGLTSALANALTRRDVARIAVEFGADAVGAQGACLYEMMQEGRWLQVVEHRGYSEDFISIWGSHAVEVDTPVTGAIRAQEAKFYNGGARLAEHYRVLFGTAGGPKWESVAIVPLMTGDRVECVLIFGFSTDQSFDEETKRFILALADQCRQALDRTHLFEAERSSRAHAEEASNAKTQFLANMSHEIRTPLAGVIGFAEIALDETEMSEETREALLRIRKNGQQLLGLIGDILDLSRVEAKQITIENAELTVADVLGDLLASQSNIASMKGLRLGLKLDDRVPKRIVTDGVKLRQILQNLISNALKFTTRGHVEVRVLNPENGQLPFEITDSGIGIAPEHQGALFRPFTQADSSMSRRFGGTGLGLALSRELAVALGGSLEIRESTPGRGTTMRLMIGLVDPDERNASHLGAPSRETIHGPPAPMPVDLRGLRVLLVEDAVDNQILISRYLQRAGVETTFASDGAAGAEAACAGDFDLILLDIQMPVLDGYQALRRMLDAGLEMPILALTAHAIKEERERALSLGFDDYLTKPVTRETLLAALRKHAPRVRRVSTPVADSSAAANAASLSV